MPQQLTRSTVAKSKYQKLLGLVAQFGESEDKTTWLREQWKWRYFHFRHKKHARRNLVFDREYNVETAAEIQLGLAGVAAEDVARGNGVYRPLTEQLFHAAMKRVRLQAASFTFVDIGSGKGKVLFMASDYPFRRIVGIEYAEKLHEVAVRNVSSYRSSRQSCSEIVPIHADALTYPLPDGPLVLFVFNALAPDFMRALMLRLDQVATQDPSRPLIVIYANFRSVKEAGQAFDGLENLRLAFKNRNVLIVASSTALALIH